jgi:hypothetical protein
MNIHGSFVLAVHVWFTSMRKVELKVCKLMPILALKCPVLSRLPAVSNDCLSQLSGSRCKLSRKTPLWRKTSRSKLRTHAVSLEVLSMLEIGSREGFWANAVFATASGGSGNLGGWFRPLVILGG